MVTIFRNIFDKQPHYITVEKALERIKQGRSAQLVIEIREMLDNERRGQLKCNLPSVCFSGKFETRTDAGIIEHSGFICLDFDKVDVIQRKSELIADPFIFACWVSPSGNGLKALVKIADPKKHRLHFEAMRERWLDIDKSGVNESRVCYESLDTELYMNPTSEVFKKTKSVEKVLEATKTDEVTAFKKLLTWLSNKGEAFVTGERNNFLFRLAGACCRYGIDEYACSLMIKHEFTSVDNSFSNLELERTIKSAYKINQFASAEFTNDSLIDRVTRSEIAVKEMVHDLYNPEIRPKDVIFGEDVKQDALNLYDSGFDKVQGIGIDLLDVHFKMKRGELSLLTGMGNYGKSSFLKWYILARVLKFGEKFALFAPEDNPAHEFYHDLVEVYLGCDCMPSNPSRPDKRAYEQAYDIISKNIFYIYPKEISPTPEYIKERFLELCVKEKIDGCIIDPFNQMANDYGKHGRTDKYLETFLSDCSRFAQVNNVYFMIVAHPKQLKKEKGNLNYPEPDVFDVADGAMWNNKVDNLLVYHRPFRGTEPLNPLATLSAKKIRRQKTVGILGTVTFELSRSKRRYFFGVTDIIGDLLSEEKPLWQTHEPNTEIADMRKHRSNDFEFTSEPVDKNSLPF